MSTISVTLPDSVKSRLEEIAKREGVSVDAYVAMVLSQRIAVADADSYVQRRAGNGSAEQLKQLLDQAPDVEPEAYDKLPTEE